MYFAYHKRSWKNDLECRFCDDKILETQEHLEECRGLSWERRNLKMDTEGGKIKGGEEDGLKQHWSSCRSNHMVHQQVTIIVKFSFS